MQIHKHLPLFKFSKDDLGITIGMITNLEYRSLAITSIEGSTKRTRLNGRNHDKFEIDIFVLKGPCNFLSKWRIGIPMLDISDLIDCLL